MAFPFRYEGLPGFRRRNVVCQTLQLLLIGLLFPILSIAYILAPSSRLGKFIKKPFIKFICHSASYVTFLCEFTISLCSGVYLFLSGYVCPKVHPIVSFQLPFDCLFGKEGANSCHTSMAPTLNIQQSSLYFPCLINLHLYFPTCSSPNARLSAN